ncbi:hypothetical protein OV203_33435 [Nannocystis sp. ILAH1]|uniref:hypothetical protein n=1 Tax=Nannocystis sp. ILAH1 TaxID=2996789 RepID=UPI00226E3410|nr:hypothetical protein [Nannocystis sp. ILAH1]MCY0992090.1 hypothetical protein [Nannocystis sp. ILAH1]
MFAAATDKEFSESASGPAEDTGYRLFSSQTIKVGCFPNDPSLRAGFAEPIDTDVGTEPARGKIIWNNPPIEGRFTPPPLRLSGEYFGRLGSGGEQLGFSWVGLGRPHATLEPIFNFIYPRTSTYIWHTIFGAFRARPNGPELEVRDFSGSRFPSHKLFVNETVHKSIPQGFLARLWDAHPSDPKRVA